MSLNRHRGLRGFRAHLVRASVLPMVVALLLLGSDFHALPHAHGQPQFSADSGDYTLPTEWSSIDGEIRIHHVSVGSGSGSPQAQAGVPTVVYSNTTAVALYPSGFIPIADDVRTTAACGCPLLTMELLIGGGGDGTGPGFGVEYAIYDDCPDVETGGGTVILGTEGSTTLPDDGLHLLSIDYSAQSPFLPRNVWVAVQFDSPSAGWVTGTPAETGFTSDIFEYPGFYCGAVVGFGLYSGFHVSLTCDGTGSGPSTPGGPNPADEAINVDPDQDLAWNDPGGAGVAAPPAGNGPAGAMGTAALAGWDAAIPEGQECGTYEHYAAKVLAGGGGGGSDNVAGGVCNEGVCDNPTVRDSFVPDENTPTKTYRIHMHVFCFDNGTGCVSSTGEVDGAMNTLSDFYEPYKIQFDYVTSFHNNSLYRDWESSEEFAMKTEYAVDPATTLNTYVVNVSGNFSFGTFPWSSDALTATGGIVMNNGQFSATATTFTHEVGHNLGLWHTHHGVSEVGQCSVCYEEAGNPSDTTGDFCSDTDPTPTNYNCFGPGGSDPCSGVPWGTTDLQNHMSYSSCRDEFSTNQSGRMHCWTEDVLSGWLLPQCAATYLVLLDTVNPPVAAACSELPSTICDPGTLDLDTTYYWQVKATNELGVTFGPVWSFTTIGEGFEDCNGNGVDDVLDISGGTSLDCQPNGIPDECDIDSGTSVDCNENDTPDDCETDSDGDGVPDDCDVCPGEDDTVDGDGDGVPDACDPCPLDNPDDSDNDGVCDSADVCPGGDDGVDTDGDSVPDFCDVCPGGDDTVDSDGDGVPDDCDICLAGDDNVDGDGDGVPDACDPCPLDNPDDSDGDGVCDSADVCPGGDDGIDTDGDSVPDFCDVCPGGDDTVDTDGDGVPDDCDLCPAGDDNVDGDGDGVPDACDLCPLDNPDDPDGDDVCTSDDNCVLFNPEQLDCQPNGVGDVCDIADGTSGDANANDIPDECEIARPRPDDETGLGIELSVIVCDNDADCPDTQSQCVSDDDGNYPGTCYIPANRWLSIKPNPDNDAAPTARRVSLVTGPGPLDRVVLGFVENPAEVVVSGPEPTNQLMAGLSATAAYVDWNTLLGGSAVRVGDCTVSPGNSYAIQAIMQGADEADEASYSDELVLRTVSTWGDVTGAMPYPDGVINLADVFEEVLGFQGMQNTAKWRLDLVGIGDPDNVPNFTVINLLDAFEAVGGFQGNPYPYAAPCDCAGQDCP